MYTSLESCRMCGTRSLEPVLDLGEHVLSGTFPADHHAALTRGPLMLVACPDCRLVQLGHSYEPRELFGAHYGYRSSLNRSMVEHLQHAVESLRKRVDDQAGDIILDIGANDGTTLSCFPRGRRLIGFDPSAERFRAGYRDDIRLIVDFFSAEAFRREMGGTAKARLITSIAMFYGLEQPLDFMRQVESILADDGLWHLELSYLPAVLRNNAYDVVCHEHLEYFALHQILWMTDRSGLRIVDVTMNPVNGGSFAVTCAKAGSSVPTFPGLGALLEKEETFGLGGTAPFKRLRETVEAHRRELPELLQRLKREGQKVLGYGASTKGNVILQYCGISPDLLPGVVEVNPDKFGCFTPGTWIPIISEREGAELHPDVFLVLPWHYREDLIRRESAFLRRGGRMLFPLPAIELVGG